MALIPWRAKSRQQFKAEDGRLTPRIWVSRLKFSDGTTFDVNDNDVFVIVGPNNSGKSATLRAIASKLERRSSTSPVVSEIAFKKHGSAKDVEAWLESSTKLVPGFYSDQFELFGNAVSRVKANYCWEHADNEIEDLAGFFCTLLDAESRLKAANPPESIALTKEGPKHPIHILQWDDSTEKRISRHFEKAFGTGLVVHRNAGRTVPIMVGEVPELKPGTDRHSVQYIVNLEKLPALHTQGDGMRSFLGVLLYSAVGSSSILLIDEPEAFLHPPQAKHLGNFLVEETDGRQLFIATHSGDVLRGVLDSESERVRVLRIRRDGDSNRACLLENSDITNIWGDPLLRYSNILDGLFHDRVIVCEGDSDCRFYSAIADAIYESAAEGERKPDVMFTHCGGKDRVALITRSLSALDVPVSAILDFDVLNSEKPLCDIVASAGGSWADLRKDWMIVKRAIDDIRPQLGVAEVQRDIDAVLKSAKAPILTEEARKKIQEALKASSPWAKAKSVGIRFVPSGDASQALGRLLAGLERLFLFVVPVGELEQFAKSIGLHGPAWVANTLGKNLENDPELAEAKSFVRKVIQSLV